MAPKKTEVGTRDLPLKCEVFVTPSYSCLMPPSTNNSIPVIRLLSSDARKTTTLAISSGLALSGMPGGRSFESIFNRLTPPSTVNSAHLVVVEVGHTDTDYTTCLHVPSDECSLSVVPGASLYRGLSG